MNVASEIEHLKLCCRKVEMDISHLRVVIAKMRSYDTDEFARELALIRKLRERIELLEGKVDKLEQGS